MKAFKILVLFLVPLAGRAAFAGAIPGVSEDRLAAVNLKHTQWDGPNCWGTTLYLLGLRKHWSYASPEEFDSSLKASCREIKAPSPGDVVDIRKKFDGSLEHHHAFLWVDENTAFSKENFFADHVASFVPLSQIQEFNDPAVTIEYYHCSTEVQFRDRLPREAVEEIDALELDFTLLLQRPDLEPALRDGTLLDRLVRLNRWNSTDPNWMPLMISAAYQFTAFQTRTFNGDEKPKVADGKF